MATATKNVPDTATRRGMPASMLEEMERDAGKGVSTAQEDNLVPLLYVLQAQSPQCLKRNPKFIEGAEAGCIWLRNAADPIVPGDEGILFQPCFFEKDIVEWAPRGQDSGGYIGRHKLNPGEGVEQAMARLGSKKVPDDERPNVFSYVLPSGNELVETRYHVGYVYRKDQVPLPFVIPLSSTGHTLSREWMFKINQRRLPSGKPAASWSHLYRLTTVFRTNSAGDWFMLAVDTGQPVWEVYADEAEQRAVIERGRALFTAFEEGTKSADEPADEMAGAPPAGGSTAGAEQHI